MAFRLLIADDDAKTIKNSVEAIRKARPDIVALSVTTPDAARIALAEGSFDVVVLDISFTAGKREGEALIGVVKNRCPDATIIMLSNLDSYQSAAACMRAGAKEFVSKRAKNLGQEIVRRIEGALARKIGWEEYVKAGAVLARKVKAVFASKALADAYGMVALAKESPLAHVLVTGPSGSGKELIAKAFKDDDKPFVQVNCAKLDGEVIESDLFGHEKGAFTSAVAQHIGYFEAANGGVIFLDEVARLSLSAQARLLRVLQSGEFTRMGSHKTLKTSVRVIAATNENLVAMVERGEFRLDLLFRLNQISITLPPLAERREDIPLIVEAVTGSHKPRTVTVAEDLFRFLCTRPWTGNIRELVDTLNAALMILACKKDEHAVELTSGDMPEKFWLASEESTGPALRVDIPLSLPLSEVGDFAQKRFLVGAGELARTKGDLTGEVIAGYVNSKRSTLYATLKRLGLRLTATSIEECLT